MANRIGSGLSINKERAARELTKAPNLDIAELAVRLCEAGFAVERPCADPRRALEAMPEESRKGWIRAAQAAAAYFMEHDWIDADAWLAFLHRQGVEVYDGGGRRLEPPLNFSDAQKVAGRLACWRHSDGTTHIRVGKKKAAEARS